MNLFKKLGKVLRQSVNGRSHGAATDAGVFEEGFYRDITEARAAHFRSLDLNVAGKSVIDIGCGIGHFSQMLRQLGADVTCVDGRQENIARLLELYPGSKACVVDAETDALLALGKFDVVFCYGLLYHLADPLGFIKRAVLLSVDWMILETCIMDADTPAVRLVPEDETNNSQALHAMGCRPSSAYVAFGLKSSGMQHVYVPRVLPAHPQFQYRAENDFSYIRNGHLMRNVFVASRAPLKTQILLPV